MVAGYSLAVRRALHPRLSRATRCLTARDSLSSAAAAAPPPCLHFRLPTLPLLQPPRPAVRSQPTSCIRSERFSVSGMTRAYFRYYTVGLNEVTDMQTSYIFGLKWTPHTKIKGAHCNFSSLYSARCRHANAAQALTPPPFLSR
jgi:hypothetical protein